MNQFGRGVNREDKAGMGKHAERQFSPLDPEPHKEQQEVPMRFLTNANRQLAQSSPCASLHPRWITVCACVFALAATLGTTGELTTQTESPNRGRPLISPTANPVPDANEQMKMQEQQNRNRNFEAVNLERKRQISDDSLRLLKLVIDLKTEVDKTSKDTLSLGIIRKADEIERLAHGVKEKMKLTMAAN
jgi:hypothetical protein